MKKLLSLLLVMILLFSLSPAALASSNIWPTRFDDSNNSGSGTLIRSACPRCGRIGDDCICWMLGDEESEEPDYHYYLPVTVEQLRNEEGERESVVHVQLRPETDEDGGLNYTMTESKANQARWKLDWLNEKYGEHELSLQYDLVWVYERDKLALPGEEQGDAPTGLKLSVDEAAAGIIADAAPAIKLNIQDSLFLELEESEKLYDGFEMELELVDDGYDISLSNSSGLGLDYHF